jgi:hypothetical protein
MSLFLSWLLLPTVVRRLDRPHGGGRHGPPPAAPADADGTRALTEILLGHRTLPAAALTEAMDRAVGSGALDPQAVLIDARRLARGPVAPVIPIGTLARYNRPAPALTGYDQLLFRSIR